MALWKLFGDYDQNHLATLWENMSLITPADTSSDALYSTKFPCGSVLATAVQNMKSDQACSQIHPVSKKHLHGVIH